LELIKNTSLLKQKNVIIFLKPMKKTSKFSHIKTQLQVDLLQIRPAGHTVTGLIQSQAQVTKLAL
jgi:hypothetical protein